MSTLNDMILAEKYKPWFVLPDGRVMWKESQAVNDFIHSNFPSTFRQGRKTLQENDSTFLMVHSPVKGKGVVLSDHLCNVPYDPRNCYANFKPGVGA